MDKSKIIFHLDIDSFFASAIRTIKPETKNKPLVVASDNLRAIVAAASYEAKRYGVKVGKPVYQAKHKCKDLIVEKPDFALFNNLSTAVFDYLAFNYQVDLQIVSIDEVYFDVTNLVSGKNEVMKLAKKMQDEILENFDLPISIGIGHNLFNAKMSTSINKPFGITVTRPNDFAKQFHHMEIEEFYGIGASTSKLLRTLGINTIGDFCNNNLDQNYLDKTLGIRYQQLLANCNGTSTNVVQVANNAFKGIGNSKTFDYDKVGLFDLNKQLIIMIERSWTRMQKRAYLPKIVTVIIRDQNKKWHSIQRKQIEPIKTIEKAIDIAKDMLIEIYEDNDYLRGIGVRFTDFVNKFNYTENNLLFTENTHNESSRIIKSVNHELMGKHLYSLREFKENKVLNKNKVRFLEDDWNYKK